MTDGGGSGSAMERLQPLCNLGPKARERIAALTNVVRIPRGRGEPDFSWAHRVVYLLSGELKLSMPEGGSRVLVGGTGLALSPIGRPGVAPVKVRAITDVELLWFDENAFDILMTWDQTAAPGDKAAPSSEGGRLNAACRAIDVHHLRQGALAGIPESNLESLAACFESVLVKAGEVVVNQNQPGDYYFVIERGRASVSREVSGASIELAELSAGDAFGEEALIAETPRNATVTMKTDGELLRLSAADFVKLLREPLLSRLDAEEAQRRVAAGTSVWLDVRFAVEYRHDGLPGASNMPLNELRTLMLGLPADKEYIAYCQTGRRSSVAAFLLSQHGLRAAFLAGGLKSMNEMKRIVQ